jgi:hypothetical protein
VEIGVVSEEDDPRFVDSTDRLVGRGAPGVSEPLAVVCEAR